jgi:hypothetical protein
MSVDGFYSDRDAIHAEEFRARAGRMGIAKVITAAPAPSLRGVLSSIANPPCTLQGRAGAARRRATICRLRDAVA